MAESGGSKQPSLIAFCTVMLSVAILSVVLRFWSNRVHPNHRFGLDDLFALLALPCNILEKSMIFWAIYLGLGRHAADVPEKDRLQGPKIIFIATFFYDAALALPRFSVLFFYNRIFQRTYSWFHYGLWVTGGINAAWLSAAWISTMFQCSPIQAAWDPLVQAKGARCFTQWNWFISKAIPSMILDLMILILPLPLIWNLQASWRRRLVVSFIFMCGYCVIIVSIGRLIALAHAGKDLLKDRTWSTVPYVMWVQTEGPISVMSVCLPNIIFLLRRIREKGLKGLTRGGTLKQSYGFSRQSETTSSKNFIRLEPLNPERLGNDTSISSKGRVSNMGGREVNVIREVNITESIRTDAA